MPERPDFVFSGVNHGPNMGEDVLYSGTVSAAMEAVTLGVPGIGISFSGSQPETHGDLPGPAGAAGAADHLASRTFPEQMLLNINLPRVPASEVRGIQVTKLGSRYFSESLTRMKDPWGREIFWIGGGTITWTGDGELRPPRGGRGLHLDHAAAHGSHQLLAARDGAGMVAGGVGEGDSYGGYRAQLVETLRRKGIRDLAVLRADPDGAAAPLRARERAAPGLRRCGAPDRQRADDLAAVGAGPLPRAARAHRPGAGAGDRHRLRVPDGAARDAQRLGLRRRADSRRWPRARGPRSRRPGSGT